VIFLAEVDAAAELLLNDAHDVVGVGVVLGEDDGLGHLAAAGEDLGEEVIAEGLHDGANLVLGDDGTVQVFGAVEQVGVELFQALGAGLAAALADIETGVYQRALVGDAGVYLVDVVRNVDPIGDGLLVGVLHHQVLIEEADGERRGTR
jgi:hypothetical protein